MYIYIQVLCQVLHCVVSLFVVELHEFFTYRGYQTLTRYMMCKHFPPFCRLSFHFLDDVPWCIKVLNCYEVQFIYFFPFCFLWDQPYFEFKNNLSRTSLVVQWLRPHAPNARGTGLIPGWEATIPHAKQNGQKKQESSFEIIFDQKEENE